MGVMRDQSLTPGGGLSGLATDSSGRPQAGVRVVARSMDGATVATTTNAAGQFQFASLRAGMVAIQAGEQVSLQRLWTAEAAPPSASRAPLHFVVHDSAPLVRGQLVDGPWNTTAFGGLVALGLLAGAIVAITTDSDPPSS